MGSVLEDHAKDFGPYILPPEEGSNKVILNVAASVEFSSDRTISEYATQIWEVKPCPV